MTSSLYLGTHKFSEGCELIDTLKSQAGKHISSDVPDESNFDIVHKYDNMLIHVKHHYDNSMEIWILLKSRTVL